MSAAIPGAEVPIWGTYVRLLSQQPVRTKCITSGIIFIISQAISQLLQFNRITSKIKVRDFGVWGTLMPVAAHYWQNAMVAYGPSSNFAKLPIDHILYRTPIMFVFSVYCKLMEGVPIREAWNFAIKTNPSIQLAALKLWPVANVINFTLIPLPLRVLWQNVVLFFWAIFLATRLRRDNARQKQLKDAAACAEDETERRRRNIKEQGPDAKV
jgi:hypothetical protein